MRERECVSHNAFPFLRQSCLVSSVPVTYAWRDELEKMTKVALSKAMGQPLQSREGGVSRPRTSQLGERPAHLKSFDERQVRFSCHVATVEPQEQSHA